MVYIISEGSQYVKIGYSKGCAQSRIKELQTGNPRELNCLVEIIDGTRKLEKELHKRFASCHVKLEWFRLEENSELMDFINANSNYHVAVVDGEVKRYMKVSK